MKYVKMLGLLAVAAAALMAFAGTASADELTSPPGTKYTGEISATSTNSSLSTPIATVTCKHSVVAGPITSQGSGVHVHGDVTTLDFSECNQTVSVKKGGTLTLDVTGTNTGTLYSTGAEVTVVFHSFFLGTVHCIYETNNTDIGVVTGGKPATLHATSQGILRQPTDGACGEESKWSGDYTVTTPSELHLDK